MINDYLNPWDRVPQKSWEPDMSETKPILKGADYTEPCVSVMKMREFGENERFDRWCTKHHHWLNETPAKTIVETL